MHVSERGSFTGGAAAARMPQSVASRRIAALEQHFGERLFDRSSRRATLTPFGRSMLPSAKRLVRLAEDMEHEAERAKLSPLRLAVPDICATHDLARLAAVARRHDVYLDFQPAGPAERAELVRSYEVRAALTAVPATEAVWSVPLGLAAATPPRASAISLESLRVGRADRARWRRIWVQPEDDVPHVRDRITRARDAVGLLPAQVAVATALTTAAAEVLSSTDLLLCSAKQAEQLALHWRPVGGVELVRGFAVSANSRDDAERVRTRLWPDIADCLGAQPSSVAAR
ncbi:DNA-binding transcriptional regulator, LysR family [Goodfellowiella coeruleoviolacea]|uniref:DNA-binding transcriptional regulator, LysR family n=1 Tax=Goodfellowiella coeruleoviolacea TaxID=334858 RepID=A0AAE3GJ40_9PSEU|nr:DNA-binding transcriptional regulator, LysR family [Goodfellowiella coeruleoviolacea]